MCPVCNHPLGSSSIQVRRLPERIHPTCYRGYLEMFWKEIYADMIVVFGPP